MPSKTPTRLCSYCGRPNVGPNRCPHAINPKQYLCPFQCDDEREQRKKRRPIWPGKQ